MRTNHVQYSAVYTQTLYVSALPGPSLCQPCTHLAVQVQLFTRDGIITHKCDKVDYISCNKIKLTRHKIN